MNHPNELNPYAGNLLVDPLGPILDREQSARSLTFLPPLPENPGQVPKHIRMHYVIQLRDFHIASLDGLRIQESIDQAIRDSYRHRNPSASRTWSVISGEAVTHKSPRASAMAVVVVGHSGSGKTQAILRAMDLYRQVIIHDTFPNLAHGHRQLAWLSVDVPASGRSDELATNLMHAFDDAMQKHAPGWQRRFTSSINKSRRDGSLMLDEWRQVAIAHFLGILHLDEVQNFFKLPTLKQRRSHTSDSQSLELRIVEDQCLKWILSLTNTWQIPLVLSGTPDGIGALMKRFANTQRFVSGGYHPVLIFESTDDPIFFSNDEDKPGFINVLGRYQFVAHPLKITREIAELVLELTAGIPRLIIALWVASHRIALERSKEDCLRQEDLRLAADTYLAPIRPAITAIRSKEPRLIGRYEDLMPRDDNFWASFWTSMQY